MSDAFTYNGLGAATPNRNQSSSDMYNDGNKEKLFKQRGSTEYYMMDPTNPEFIGANGNTGLQSYVTA